MARQPENTFIASIHRLLPVDVYRQKNHNPYNSGIPDCWYSGVEGDLWVEYKFIELPKRDTSPVPVNLSELQKHWIRHRHTEGRNVGVIVGCKAGGVWFPGMSWDESTTKAEFEDQLLERLALSEIIYRNTMVRQ